jgi:hypothetical protein
MKKVILILALIFNLVPFVIYRGSISTSGALYAQEDIDDEEGGGGGSDYGCTTCDCAGVADGSAYYDPCGRCVGGTTGEVACPDPVDVYCYDPCYSGCIGYITPTIYTDGEGCEIYTDCEGSIRVCPTGSYDCAGVLGGTAYLDPCGVCIGGTTGKSSICVVDCNNVAGGSAHLDNCKVCVGGNTGKTACTDACSTLKSGTTTSTTITATLSVDKSVCVLGDQLTFNITLSCANAVAANIVFNSSCNGATFPAFRTKSIYAPAPGLLTFNALVTYSLNGVYNSTTTNDLNISVEFPNTDEIENALYSAMVASWENTLNLSATNPGQLEEEAFAITASANINSPISYLLSNRINTQVPCGNALIEGTATFDDAPSSYPGSRYLIGYFHTHPSLLYCVSPYCTTCAGITYSRIGGPSSIDKSSADVGRLPLFVMDYFGNIKSGIHYYFEELFSYGLYQRLSMPGTAK